MCRDFAAAAMIDFVAVLAELAMVSESALASRHILSAGDLLCRHVVEVGELLLRQGKPIGGAAAALRGLYASCFRVGEVKPVLGCSGLPHMN